DRPERVRAKSAGVSGRSVACRRVDDRVGELSAAVRADGPAGSAPVGGGAPDDDRLCRAGQRHGWYGGSRCGGGRRARRRGSSRGARVAVTSVVPPVVSSIVVVVVCVVLPVLARLIALLLVLLEVLLALILAFSQSLSALVLQGLALLGGAEPRAPLVLLLPQRVAVELPGATSAGPVAARRPRLSPE